MIQQPQVTPLKMKQQVPEGYLYEGEIPCAASGQFGFCVRVLPHSELAATPFHPGLLTWG